MASSDPDDTFPKFFTVEHANKTLPLVKAIVGDIVRQFEIVGEMSRRLSAVMNDRRPLSEYYNEELAQSQAELDAEESKLASYIDELKGLGVELKGPDGLCDFPSMRDGRPVYLCWRLGEPEILHWHELDAGFSGRQPLKQSPAIAGRR